MVPSKRRSDRNSCSRKVRQVVNSDRISNLPDSITEKILSYLSIRDAAKTSILCKTWRNKWRHVPRLVFDHDFRPFIANNTALGTTREKLFFRIYQVLLLHRGPITEFKLTIPALEYGPEIDQLMLFLHDKDIQEFTYSIFPNKNMNNWLPSSIFSYQHLRHMNLSYCLFKPPTTFGGFGRLIHLTLCRVRFICDMFASFISKCPLLELLKIVDCADIGSLTINCPNLKTLHFEGSLESICFKKLPLLGTLFIELTKEIAIPNSRKGPGLPGVFKCLPSLEHLCLCYNILDYLATGALTKRLPAATGHLEVLELLDMDLETEEDMSWVLYFIMGSPNLQKLKIVVYTYDGKTDGDTRQVLEAQDVLEGSDHLREIRIEYFTGMKSEFEFVKFLLTKSVALQKLFIQPPPETDAKKAFHILTKLTELNRASPEAQILYLYDN